MNLDKLQKTFQIPTLFAYTVEDFNNQPLADYHYSFYKSAIQFKSISQARKNIFDPNYSTITLNFHCNLKMEVAKNKENRLELTKKILFLSCRIEKFSF